MTKKLPLSQTAFDAFNTRLRILDSPTLKEPKSDSSRHEMLTYFDHQHELWLEEFFELDTDDYEPKRMQNEFGELVWTTPTPICTFKMIDPALPQLFKASLVKSCEKLLNNDLKKQGLGAPTCSNQFETKDDDAIIHCNLRKDYYG